MRLAGRIIVVVGLALCMRAAVVYGQEESAKKVLTIDDYTKWRRVTSTALSEDGAWMTFGYSQRKKDDVLYVRHLDTEKVHEVPRASRPRLSDDSQWVAYMLSPPVAEVEKLRKANKPVVNQAELLNLASGEKSTWDSAASFSFPKGSKCLVVKKTKSDRDAKHSGTDMILRDLEKGYQELIGSVSAFAFNKPGTVLAYTVDAADQNGNGLYVLYLETGMRRPLDNGKAEYARMTWDEEGTALAVLKGKKDKDYTQKENKLLVFTGFDEGMPVRIEYDVAEAFDFPKNMVISEKAALSFNKGVTKVFFGIKEQEATEEKKKKDRAEKAKANGDEAKKEEEAIANVDIWHWQDDQIQSVQMIRANRDRNRTHRCVFDLENKRFEQLTDDEMRSISITRDGRWGIGTNDRAYISDWKERQADYYRVDIDTNERTLFLEAQGRTLGLSPDSKHFLYWKEGHVWHYDIERNVARNLTKDAPTDFANQEFDHPGIVPPYGVTGWTKDGQGVILTHRYDLWLQPLDGSTAINLTGGVGTNEEIRFRYVRTDPEERSIDLTKPILLSAYGQWTKKAGFYRLDNGKLEPLIYDDKSFGRVTKAKQADRMMYTIQTFEDFPDYYVSDSKFGFPKRVTDANPIQAEYKWGRRILFDFTNSGGVHLQGTLAIPDDYEEGQRLPMLVNYYEKNSQNLHRYAAPRYASSPQFAGYVSAGYLVMQPDVHFNTRTSHSDMLECVEAAVKKVIEMGYVDPERVALHGHSYSGQGSAYISTRSNMFAAIVAGAAATNLVSDFNQLWKSAGTNQHRYDTYGQGRFGTNPYDDLELYQDQSAVHHARTMDTPLLLLHGTDDGSVEWLQAVEFYNALRYNDKPVILLSYPGEGHGLRKYENQLDFQKRMREFLDHHLRDAPAPTWMTKGIPFIKKKK